MWLHGTSSRGYYSHILHYSILNCSFIDFVDSSDLTWQGIDKYGSISKTMNGIMLTETPAPPSILLSLFKTLQRVHWQTGQAQKKCSRNESMTIHIPSVLIQTSIVQLCFFEQLQQGNYPLHLVTHQPHIVRKALRALTWSLSCSLEFLEIRIPAPHLPPRI